MGNQVSPQPRGTTVSSPLKVVTFLVAGVLLLGCLAGLADEDDLPGSRPTTGTATRQMGGELARDQDSGQPQGRSGEAQWGFYVYMAADNSLWDEAKLDLNEMMRIGSRPGKLEIVTLTDYQLQSGEKDKAGIENGTTRAYHVLRNELEQTPLSELDGEWSDEVDMGQGESLSTFLDWAIDSYPARNKVLVIWDHGKGWKKVAEDSGGSHLTMPEIREALDRVGAQFSIIGFDACLMAQTEIIHTLSPYTQYVLGSQAYEPSFGWTYDHMLGSLLRDIDTVGNDTVAQRLVNSYVESYRNQSKSSGYSVTYSAIEVQAYMGLESAIHDMASLLGNLSWFYSASIKEARDGTQTYQDNHFLDLYHFTQRIAQRIPLPQVKAKAMAVQQALELAVVAEDHWNMPNRDDVSDSHGLSIYFPPSSVRGDYYDLTFTLNSSWPGFLDDFLHPHLPDGSFSSETTPLDLNNDSFPETLGWWVNFTLDQPIGHLTVQLLDSRAHLIDIVDIDLNVTGRNITGETFEVPLSGEYTIQYLLFDHEGYLAQQVNQGPFELDLRLPDLRFTGLGLRYLGQPVEGVLDGDNVSLWAQVVNQGTIASEPYWLNITANGIQVHSEFLDSLQPNIMNLVQAEWSPDTTGGYLLNATVEMGTGKPEANPLDNHLERTVEVFPANPTPFSPELTISRLAGLSLLDDDTGFTPAILRVTITNPSTNPFDLIELVGEAPPGWEVDTPGPSFLIGGGSVSVNVTVRVPLRTVSGSYQVELTGVARDGTLGLPASLMVAVPGYTGAELSIVGLPQLSPGGSGQVMISVTNIGNLPATFVLNKELPGAITGSLPDALLEVGPFETRNTTLTLEIADNLALGVYRLRLFITDPLSKEELVGLDQDLLVTEGDAAEDNPALSALAVILALSIAAAFMLSLIARSRESHR